MQSNRLAGALILVALLLVGGFSYARMWGRPRDPSPIPGVPVALPVFTVTATNYAFDAPDTLPAGAVILRLVNHGSELHHLVVIPLPEGKSVADLIAAHGDPSWAAPVGGANAVTPGGEAETAVLLAPGRYLLVCFIPGADGKAHVTMGMSREVVVTATAAPATLPTGDVTLRLVDYDFTLSAPLTAGHHQLSVENGAQQGHEVVIVKLLPGKHLADVIAWAGHPAGPPPGLLIGGASPMAPGARNVVLVDLTPGTYGFICFLDAPDDKRPHFMHGMEKEFVVQ